MWNRTKVRIGLGSAAAVAIVAGALTTAYASPWGHSNGNSSSSNSSSSSSTAWSPNIVTGTTTLKDVSTTIPSTGDVNPYGVAVVPHSVGNLVRGDILVSNYNNKGNLNGTGASIIEVNPNTGKSSLFASLTPSRLPSTCPGGIGLTAGLVVLQNGWVVVESLPTSDGTSKTAKSGCLIVLNSLGHAKLVIARSWLSGPWGMTAIDNGNNVQLFVTTVLNNTSKHWNQQINTATVVRINLWVTRQTFQINTAVVVASNLPVKLSTAGFIQGPTGVAIIGNKLFIVNSLTNKVTWVNWATTRHSSAGTGSTLTSGGLLSAPLVVIVFHGVLLVTNGNNGNLIAINLSGRTSLVKALDTNAVSGSSPGAGALFGLASSMDGQWVYYADDIENTLSAVGPLLNSSSSNNNSNNNSNSGGGSSSSSSDSSSNSS
jgi:hypothetical protein